MRTIEGIALIGIMIIITAAYVAVAVNRIKERQWIRRRRRELFEKYRRGLQSNGPGNDSDQTA